jgi:hypothetical protein
LHCSQVPHADVTQQTPSTQLPLSQAAPLEPHDPPTASVATQLSALQ